MLSLFLRFCTGSSVMSVDDITVTFNNSTGFQRWPGPVGPVLELSVMYTDIADLRFEFNCVLNGGHEAYQFNIS